jgi:hypothetical protein
LRIEKALQEMETHGETVVPVGKWPLVPNRICYGIVPHSAPSALHVPIPSRCLRVDALKRRSMPAL